MAEESTIEVGKRLSVAVRQMLTKMQRLRAENDKLRKECQRLQTRLETKTQQAQMAQSQLETFKIAATLKGTYPQTTDAQKQTQEAKNRISQIVREIDQCIALLKQ